jgi:hypothetical protein
VNPCWQVSFYFTRGRKKKLLRGQYCGCQPGDSREDAIARIGKVTVEGGTVAKICARRSKPDHYCFTNEKETQ